MDEKMIVYWMSWLLIVIIRFFMNESKQRTFFFFTMLTIIMTYELSLETYIQVKISIAFIILIVASFIYFLTFPFSYYRTLVTFITIIGYVALLLWEKTTPIWFIFSATIVIPIIIASVISLLVSQLFEQIAIALVTVSIGQLFYGFITIHYLIANSIVDFRQFIIMYNVIVILIVFYFVRLIFTKMRWIIAK